MSGKRGRPTKRCAEVEDRIIEGLSAGTPLTIVCKPDDMPGVSTVYDWMDADEEFSGRIARAREMGWDQIAIDALNIADEVTDNDSIETKFGEIPNKEWLMRSKLRVEKRYGEMIKHAGADGGPMSITVSPEDAGL